MAESSTCKSPASSPAAVRRPLRERLFTVALRQCSVFVLAAATAGLCQASDLESINKRLEKAPNWIEDRAEIGYITLRCGVLLFAISEVFLSDPRRMEIIVKQATRIQDASKKLLDQGALISNSVGLGEQVVDLRVAQLSKAYGYLIVQNRALHNDIFKGMVEADFLFCMNLVRE